MVKISITGALVGYTRQEAADMIASAMAEFSPGVNHATDYLVATKLDTSKARKAQSIGVRIITQGEFEEFVAAGSFPVRADTNKPKGSMFNSPPELDWHPVPLEDRRIFNFEYCDADGVITQRVITPLAVASYTSVKGLRNAYLKATDHSENQEVRTFRADRIIGQLPSFLC